MLLSWWGCGGAPADRQDPELDAAAAALAAWRRGEALLAAGDADAARGAFAEASALRPEPVLVAWEGRAAAAAGDHAAALGLLRAALAGEPALAAARWALALELARTGDAAAAAAELQRALADGAGTPADVRLDPDWAPFLGDPAFTFVPAAAVSLTASALPDTTYWGSELTVTLELTGRPGPEVAWSAPATGPVALRRVSEVVAADRRTLELGWVVTGAGPVALGPFGAATAGARVEAPARALTADAPPGREVAPPAPAWPDWSPDGLPAALARRGGVVWAPIDGVERVTTDPPRPQLLVRTTRDGSRRAWVGVADLPVGAAITAGRQAPVAAP